MSKSGAIFIILVFLVFPSPALCKVLKSDTIWSGEVSLDQDVLVPAGVTLTISPGTIIRIIPSESTKTDPEYMSPMTEIIIRGTLRAEGKENSPVTFLVSGKKQSQWAGIIVDGGKVMLNSCFIQDAETAIDVMQGSVSVNGSTLSKNRYGLSVEGPGSTVIVEASRVSENDYGVVLLNGARIEGKGNVIKENRKKDTYSSEAKDYHLPDREYKNKAEKQDKNRIYGDQALLGATVWQGRIQVNGIIRVPENSRLVIMPGTLVEFSRKDTDKDGIGENGLLIQGVIIAKGTKADPIIFRSSEKQKKMGDWDAINIMNSDKTQNLIEHCQIEDAYRGLHFHFSNVAVTDSILRNNYRGVQFQESVVEIRGTHFTRNRSAFQARDSEIQFTGNVLYRNYSGMNVFRNNITLSGNSIMNNYLEGMRVREGLPVVERNFIYGNRHGLMVTDAFYGTFSSNMISGNLESGMALKGTDNIHINGNFVQGNGVNGITIQDSSAVISGNFISDNRERGIGVLSFQGVITANNIIRNGLYNLGIDGERDVSARMNWWGEGDVKKKIFDKDNDASKGRADYLPVLEKPVAFPWPLDKISADTLWHGPISVERSVTVASGVNLTITPKSKVLFSAGAGLAVLGKIIAAGEKNAGIEFVSAAGLDASAWDEILLDHATGSTFSYCRFENATWALHSHFTDLRVENCSFANNYGGMRFTSGPVEVRRSFFGNNEIGIRAFRGNAVFTENIITGNRIGIFVREKGGGLTITKNNIFANSEYNVRIGDFNDEDVDAKENWWGTATPVDTIFDERLDPGIGRVKFEPVAKQPLPLDAVSGIRSGINVNSRSQGEGGKME